MMKIKSIAAAAGLACLAVSGAAKADALATSILLMDNFQILKADGSVFDASDFLGLVSNSQADISASYNGVGSTTGGSSALGQIDLTKLCYGPGCATSGIAENAFPVISTAGGAPTGSFASADQFEAGAPISGLVPLSDSATVRGGSYAQVKGGTGSGSATANNELSADFALSFTLASSQTLTFSFLGTIYQEAFLTPGSGVGSFARTTSDFEITILDENGDVVFAWTPDGAAGGITGGVETADACDLDYQRSRNGPSTTGVSFGPTGAALGTACSGNFSATSVALTEGVLYTINGKIKTTADAQWIPEPGSLALLGAGLAGLGVVARRRKSA